jgi:hypothetical protein
MQPAVSVWFDTEFTDLGEPELLSVGIVTVAGNDLYVELLDEHLQRRASDFVAESVLPMFGAIPGARASTYLELATRSCDFLLQLGAPVRLVFDYVTDRELFEHALRRAPKWSELEAKLSWEFAPADIYDTDVGTAAMKAVWRQEEAAGLGRHHALSDARALRAACLAVSHWQDARDHCGRAGAPSPC